MAISFVNIDSSFKDMEQLEHLSKEAFPNKEYLNPNAFIKFAQNGDFNFLAIYAQNTFIGFVVIKLHKTMTYLFFLAIKKEFRNMGYGSKTIQKLQETYPNYTHTVDFEILDDSAPNKDQRIKRKQFYLRNGYKETGLFISYFGNSYEAVYIGKNFDEELFKEMVKTMPLEKFDPIFFTK